MEEKENVMKCPHCGGTAFEGMGREDGYVVKCVSCGTILENNIEDVEENTPYCIPDMEYMFDDTDNLDEEEDYGDCEECKL